MESIDSIEELDRMKYFHDGPSECLAIDIRGLTLKMGGILWVWAYKPQGIPGSEHGYTYPSSPTPAWDCTSDNSLKVKLAGKLATKRGDKQDPERVWIPIQVPDQDMTGVHYLLLPTNLLEVSGWGL